MTDVYANIQAGKYENTVKWPVGDYRDPVIAAQREAYKANDAYLDDLFYNDCCYDLGLDPGKDSSRKLFQKAYEDGHGFGHYDIYSHMIDLHTFVNEWAGLKRGEDEF